VYLLEASTGSKCGVKRGRGKIKRAENWRGGRLRWTCLVAQWPVFGQKPELFRHRCSNGGKDDGVDADCKSICGRTIF
jgi:hypothetical protein